LKIVGVRRVVNEILIRPTSGLPLPDIEIENNIKEKLAAFVIMSFLLVLIVGHSPKIFHAPIDRSIPSFLIVPDLPVPLFVKDMPTEA